MYVDHLRVGFYWGSRGENAHDCARRTVEFLSGLGRLLDSLGTWFDLSDARNQGEDVRVMPSLKGLEQLLTAGAARNDLGESMPTLGFALSLGNRTEADFVHLKIICGGSSQWVQNICILRFPRGTMEYEMMLRLPLPVDLSRWIVRCWEPDRGVVTSQELDDSIPIDDDQTEVGWITYLSDRSYPGHFDPPESVLVKPIDGLGRLFVLSADAYSPSDPFQASKAKDLFNRINL